MAKQQGTKAKWAMCCGASHLKVPGLSHWETCHLCKQPLVYYPSLQKANAEARKHTQSKEG